MPKTGQTIFVVDDEAVIAQSLAAILNNAGFQAKAFDHPDKAIAACNDTSPDLLISDVKIPGMTGIELAIHFRTTQPECRILSFSGTASTEYLLAEAHKRGYDFHLLWKPSGRSLSYDSQLTLPKNSRSNGVSVCRRYFAQRR